MDKNSLNDYIDVCEFIKETEAEIRRLEKNRKTVKDKVQGSNPDWPYEQRSFNVSGTTETYAEADALRRERELLEVQKKEAQELKAKVEEWMKTVPFRMQRIIRYKMFEGMTWGQVAQRIGRKATADSVRKEFEKFLK